MVLLAVVLGLAPWLSGCGKDGANAAPAPASNAVPVTVKKMAFEKVPLSIDAVGRAEGSREVEIRARVTGILEKRLYEEGAATAGGATLFQIDPAPYELEVQQARATLQQEKARTELAEQEAKRLAPLVQTRAVSQREADTAQSNVRTSAAAIAVAEARLKEAELNLSYTRVVSPIGGVTGRSLRSEGSLVTANTDSALLTTVTRVDPVWVRFSLAEPDFDRIRNTHKQASVQLLAGDGGIVSDKGRLNFAASTIDTKTGAVELRAEFPNPDLRWLPGQFVKVRVLAGEQTAMRVPQAAVQQNEQSRIVMVVAEGKAAPRAVQTSSWIGGDMVITGGLQEGDQVIVDNLVKVRPGTAVQPTVAASVAPAPAAAAPVPTTTAKRERAMGNLSRFFIDRPVFAMVIAVLITLAGAIAAFALPVAQYPDISPPTVTISTTYPGASAETIAATVAAPIEEQLSGAEGMIYFNSNSGSDSTMTITATFEVGTDVDKAVFQLNNRVQVALPRLPEEVRRNGVLVQKKSNDILVVIALRSTDGSRSSTYLADYANTNMLDDLKRIPGVGDVTLFGSISSMRVWLQPDKMARLGITPTDVATVIRGQNTQFAAGKVGAEPAPPGQALTFTVNARGRLSRVEDFENLIVRANGPNGVLRMKDVATVELGALNYDTFPTVDGKTAVGMAVFLQTGANALAVSDAVKNRLEENKGNFPPGVEYLIPFDTTLVVKSSIHEVKVTIFEAALLVLAVVFLFLQTWRATIIPMLAVPVSIIGTFAGLYILGFSINTLTLFAMVLAIGIVVDDAIVVLENVERLMREQKLSAREASIEAMQEVAGAVIAIVLVLCAVFIPVAFLGGLAGQLYKQFAVTVAVAVVISGFTALTLTPALCALLLEVHDEEPRLFKPFNRAFNKLTERFLSGVNLALARRLAAGLFFLGMVVVLALLFWRVPSSFLPPEDQGYLLGTLQLPDGASIQRTKVTAEKIQKIIADEPIVDHAFVVPGRDLIGGSNKTNAGTMFILLKDWDERTKTAPQLAGELTKKGQGFTDGQAIVFNPPSIRGLGTAGGFEFYLQSRNDNDTQRLGQATRAVVDALAADPRLQGMATFYRPTAPQLFAEVDREKAISMGVAPEEVFATLQSTFGTLYVNDFNLSGRTLRVQLQAEPSQRSSPEQLGSVYVRSTTTGEMVPLRALLRVRETAGPEQVERFNGFLAAKVLGSGKPGVSSGQAIQAVEEVLAKAVPPGYTLAWSGQAFQEKRTGSASTFAFGLAIVMVFLILAALYERWRLPTAVVLAVPFAVTGALALVWARGMENDIYFQIGLVVLIGLAAKNAILIVEFAQQGLLRGMSAKDAAVDAARLRFRPIVMTSLAFVFGVLPLAISSGAGSAARRSMGTGVVGGMLIATFVATIFVPLFFTWFASRRSMSEAFHHKAVAEADAAAAARAAEPGAAE